MKLADFDFTLPDNLIAQEPSEPRDHCRLLRLNRATGEISHHQFRELSEMLGPDDVVVINETKVFPARLFGTKPSGGRVEILLARHLGGEDWEVISKPGLKLNQTVEFGELQLLVLEDLGEGLLRVKFNLQGEAFWGALELIGHTPLPPYITSGLDELKLRQAYQTVYARQAGSVAAPTAGFHFTPEVFGRLAERGVEVHRLTLHVSLGTFRPVKTEIIEKHKMHPEGFSLSRETAVALNKARFKGKRIVAVGTTTTRVLESRVDEAGVLIPGEGETEIFIYPPYKFKFVDALITNFHLPKSTLLMLISAFVSYPNTPNRFVNFKASLVGQAYLDAISHQYRFYSFGDAMLIS